MFPRLPVIGLPSYGLMVALGFVAALILVWHVAKSRGLSPESVQDVVVWASLWGLVGAKALLVALEPRAFLATPWTVLFQGGVFYGGFISGAVAGWLRSRQLGMDPWAVADVLTPSLALAHAFGRLGCLLAGCCWGISCDLPWAIRFTDPLSMPMQSGWPGDQLLHPTQIYEAAGNLALMGLALMLLRRRAFPGLAWWSYVGAYGALRFFLEFLRGDVRGSIGPISTSQAVGLAAVVVALAMIVVLARRARAFAIPAAAAGDAR
jgi:phosphatidylglycerol:prolipoprotein diacylglycerol transferase